MRAFRSPGISVAPRVVDTPPPPPLKGAVEQGGDAGDALGLTDILGIVHFWITEAVGTRVAPVKGMVPMVGAWLWLWPEEAGRLRICVLYLTNLGFGTVNYLSCCHYRRCHRFLHSQVPGRRLLHYQQQLLLLSQHRCQRLRLLPQRRLPLRRLLLRLPLSVF